MARKLAYWIITSLLAALSVFSGVLYLSGTPQVIEGFAHVGYPPHLRVILGVAKLAGGLTLIAPGLPLLKEWAYAGFAFTWIIACVAHFSAGDGVQSISPLVLLGFLIVSYLTRPVSRRLAHSTASA